jgi:hypothetical protein
MDVDPPNESGSSVKPGTQDLVESNVDLVNEIQSGTMADPLKLNSTLSSPSKSPERPKREKSPYKSPKRQELVTSPSERGRSSPSKSLSTETVPSIEISAAQKSPARKADDNSEDVFEFLQFPERPRSPAKVEKQQHPSNPVPLHSNNEAKLFEQQANRFENQIVKLRKELSLLTQKYEEKVLQSSKEGKNN